LPKIETKDNILHNKQKVSRAFHLGYKHVLRAVYIFFIFNKSELHILISTNIDFIGV